MKPDMDKRREGSIAADALPEQLARRFGHASSRTRRHVAALCGAVDANPAAQSAFARWKQQFGTACGHDLDRPDRRLDELSALWAAEAPGVGPAGLLFAIHTYFALIVKLLIRETVGRGLRHGDELHAAMAAMEASDTPSVRPLLAVDENLFGWYAHAWSPGVERVVAEVLADLPHPQPHAPSLPGDQFKPLYEALVPRPVRHRLGEYYTPDWLARHLLDAAGYCGQPGVTLLDPSCGSGTFLVQAIGRVLATARPSVNTPSAPALARAILAGVAGFDLNPLAVLAARANYLLALADLVDDWADLEIPVYLRDAILPSEENGVGQGRAFDFVVGNPPWIVWDNLPEAYRRATLPLWQQYGLFSLSATDARHGGGKKDLSMLLTYVAADRYLKPGGRLAFVLTQTLLQTKGAGDGFRRFRLGPDGEPLAVLRVDDMVRLRPFAPAANWTATLVLEKGRETEYPVPYTIWAPGETGKRSTEGAPSFRCRQYKAEPIAADRPSSPWFLRPEGFCTPLAALVGPSEYEAHLGANSGGANAVYWVELIECTADGVRVRNLHRKGRGQTECVEQSVEPDLLYPLVRWGDVDRWRARPGAHLLLVQDLDSRQGIAPELMARDYPRTLAYLSRFERLLRDRAAYRRYQSAAAFYSMYNVGPYTAAPWKVIWRRMDQRIRAAVVGPIDDPLLGPRPVVPQETCVLVAADSADEAHYLCAVLNSAVVDFLVRAHSVRGGKGFGTPSMLDYIRLPKFHADDPRHAALAQASRDAQAAVAAGEDPAEIQGRVDRLAGTLWELTEEEVETIRGALE